MVTVKHTTLLLSIVLGACLACSADELADLQAQRIETLQQAVGLIDAQYRAGEAAIEQLLDAQAAQVDAKLDAASTPSQRIEVLTQALSGQVCSSALSTNQFRSTTTRLAPGGSPGSHFICIRLQSRPLHCLARMSLVGPLSA